MDRRYYYDEAGRLREAGEDEATAAPLEPERPTSDAAVPPPPVPGAPPPAPPNPADPAAPSSSVPPPASPGDGPSASGPGKPLVAALVVGALVVIGLAVAGLVALSGEGEGDSRTASPSSTSASSSVSTTSLGDVPSDGVRSLDGEYAGLFDEDEYFAELADAESELAVNELRLSVVDDVVTQVEGGWELLGVPVETDSQGVRCRADFFAGHRLEEPVEIVDGEGSGVISFQPLWTDAYPAVGRSTETCEMEFPPRVFRDADFVVEDGEVVVQLWDQDDGSPRGLIELTTTP